MDSDLSVFEHRFLQLIYVFTYFAHHCTSQAYIIFSGGHTTFELGKLFGPKMCPF